MPFAARNEEGWRICHRKGRTCKFVNQGKFPTIEIRFASQVKAKECADELNEYWDDYWKAERKPGATISWDLCEVMLMTLVSHGGISTKALKEIRDA